MVKERPKNQDISELQEQLGVLSKELETLRQQKEQFCADAGLYGYLYDNLNDAVFIIALDGTILDVNQVAVERLGYTRQELLAMRPQDVNDASYSAAVADRMTEVVKKGSHFFETVHVAKDGRRIPTEISSRIIRFKGNDAFLSLARDISDRKKAKADLSESERKYRDLFENASDAIFILDKHYRYLDVNRRAIEMFGYSREEFLSMSVFDIIPEDQVPRSDREFQKLVTRGSYEGFIGKIRTKDGLWLDIEVSSTAIYENGAYAGSRDIVRDISDRVRAEKEMLAAKEQAEAASIAKSRFVANVSHEVRTPLNGLLGMLSFLRPTKLDPTQRKYLDLATLAGERLLQVTKDILDFARIEARMLAIETSSFEIRQVIEQTLAILSHKAEDKGLRLFVNEGPEVPLTVWGDPGRLSQIVMNLADNAIKFTEKGAVAVHFEVREKDADSVVLLFRVQDTGIGVSRQDQHNIFSAFTQVEGTHSRRLGGTGLGLAISSQLADLMGGEMWLESPPTTVIEEVVPSVGHGRGAAFFFTVRLGCHGPPAANKPRPDERAGFLPEPVTGRILLADDDSTNRLLTATVLEHLGLIVDTAENGRQVLEKMKEYPFDLVLMDVQMPEMDGFAATGAIREAERGTSQHVPIIALTAFAMQDDRERCLAAGMDDYLAKPVAAAEIKRLILRYLRQK